MAGESKSVIWELPVKLTREEREQRSKELAETVRAHDNASEEKKATAADFKTKIDDYNRQIRKLSNAVRSGEEMQSVECLWEADPVRLLMNLRRCDTGVLVTTRPMTAEERQTELPGARAN